MKPKHMTQGESLFPGRKLASVMGRVFLAAVVSPMLLLLWDNQPVLGQEYIRDQEPMPESVDQVVTPIELSFQEKPEVPVLFPWLKEQLKDTPAFIRDTKLSLNLRTYYFDRDNYSGSSPQENEAWALGGSISYQSGWLLDHFGVGTVLYTSQPLYAPDDKDGSLLLKPGQEGYTVLGQLYGRVKVVEDNFINIYRYQYNTPYINQFDNRMTPITFEGYTATGFLGSKDSAPGFNYGFGYIEKIKLRNSDTFIPMSEAAGVENVNRGVSLAGGRISFKGFTLGAIDYYSADIINIFYAEGDYKLRLTKRLGLLFALQFTDQQSVGSDLQTGFPFKTNQFGVKAETSYGGGILTLAYTTDSNGADLQNPWGGYPGYTSVQVKDFNRAGESSLMVKASYDFTHLGLEGVTAYALIVHGWGRINPSTGQGVPNENEMDLDLQWRPKTGFFKNFWPRFRYAVVHEYEGQERYLHDFRIILNYDFSFL